LHPVPDSQQAGLSVAVYDASYRLQGYVRDYESCAVTFQHLDTGTGTLVLSESHPLTPLFVQAGNEVVPVVVTAPSGRRWSGRVEQASVDFGNGSSPAPPGRGTVTVTLVDEWPWLKRMLASPFGSSTALSYGTGAPEFDIRTGPIDTVVKGYISDASARIWGKDSGGRLLGPVVVVPPLTTDTTATVTLQAKWTPLSDLVSDLLRANNRTLVAYLWLPGDPQPPGLALTAATVVVDIAAVRNNQQLVWDDSTFLSRKIAVKSPTSFEAIIGGSGSGTSQTFATYTDSDLKGSLGSYGFPESYFSSASTSSAASIQQDGASQLRATEGGLAVQATVQDGVPWTFGTDYQVGDLAGVRALGLDIRQRVVSVQLIDDRANGFRVVPTIGDDQATLTIQQRLFRTVRSLGMRVQHIQTGA
jgi:hypothetical protein